MAIVVSGKFFQADIDLGVEPLWSALTLASENETESALNSKHAGRI